MFIRIMGIAFNCTYITYYTPMNVKYKFVSMRFKKKHRYHYLTRCLIIARIIDKYYIIILL